MAEYAVARWAASAAAVHDRPATSARSLLGECSEHTQDHTPLLKLLRPNSSRDVFAVKLT